MDDFSRFVNDMRSRDRQERKYLLLYLKGLPKPVNLRVAEEAVDPFRQRLFSPTGSMTTPSPFYRLSTFNGKEVLLSLPDVEYVNFLFQIEEPLTFLLVDSARELKARAKEDRHDGTADLYFRGRPEPISIDVNDSIELKQIFEALAGKKSPEGSSFARFTDDQDQVIAFRPERLILLVAHRGSIQMTSEADYEGLFHPPD
jgi:hypothetical protein